MLKLPLILLSCVMITSCSSLKKCDYEYNLNECDKFMIEIKKWEF